MKTFHLSIRLVVLLGACGLLYRFYSMNSTKTLTNDWQYTADSCLKCNSLL